MAGAQFYYIWIRGPKGPEFQKIAIDHGIGRYTRLKMLGKEGVVPEAEENLTLDELRERHPYQKPSLES